MYNLISKVNKKSYLNFLLIFSIIVITDNPVLYGTVMVHKSREDVQKLIKTRHYEEKSLYPISFLSDYYEQRDQLYEKIDNSTGLKFGLAYTTLSQYAFNGNHNRDYMSGEIDFFGTWQVLRNNYLKTLFGFRLDSRHKMTNSPPAYIDNKFNLFSNTAGVTFNDESLALLDLWIDQEVVKDTLRVRIGKMNFYDIMNGYAFDSQSFYYLNNVFNGEPGAVEPENGLAIIGSYYFTKNYYLLLGLTDVNGKDNLSDVKIFFDNKEYLKAVEFGYRSSLYNHYQDSYHIYVWHADGSDKFNTKSDIGLSVTAQKVLWGNIIPFVQYSANKGRATVFKNLALGGVVFNNLFGHEFQSLGLAVSYGNSSVDSEGKEMVGEAFYRLQLLPYLQVTPDYQIIRTKIRAHDYKTTNVLGLRFRVSV